MHNNIYLFNFGCPNFRSPLYICDRVKLCISTSTITSGWGLTRFFCRNFSRTIHMGTFPVYLWPIWQIKPFVSRRQRRQIQPINWDQKPLALVITELSLNYELRFFAAVWQAALPIKKQRRVRCTLDGELLRKWNEKKWSPLLNCPINAEISIELPGCWIIIPFVIVVKTHYYIFRGHVERFLPSPGCKKPLRRF